jgi:hypothetical protein
LPPCLRDILNEFFVLTIRCILLSVTTSANREIFAGFVIESGETQYTIAGGKPTDVTEIVVTGPSNEPLSPPADLLSGLV